MDTQKALLEEERSYLAKMIEEEIERAEHYVRHFSSAKVKGNIEKWRARVELLVRIRKHINRVWNKV